MLFRSTSETGSDGDHRDLHSFPTRRSSDLVVLSSAFALQLPPHIGRFRLIVLLNLGRISSYTVIGLLAGALGQFGISLDQTRTLQTVLFTAAHVLLLLLGLYLAGLSDLARRIEGAGKPVWRRLNPLLNRLLPIKSVPACFGVGLLWDYEIGRASCRERV